MPCKAIFFLDSGRIIKAFIIGYRLSKIVNGAITPDTLLTADTDRT